MPYKSVRLTGKLSQLGRGMDLEISFVVPESGPSLAQLQASSVKRPASSTFYSTSSLHLLIPPLAISTVNSCLNPSSASKNSFPQYLLQCGPSCSTRSYSTESQTNRFQSSSALGGMKSSKKKDRRKLIIATFCARERARNNVHSSDCLRVSVSNFRSQPYPHLHTTPVRVSLVRLRNQFVSIIPPP